MITDFVIEYKQPWLSEWQRIQATPATTLTLVLVQADGVRALFPGCDVRIIRREIHETIVEMPTQTSLI